MSLIDGVDFNSKLLIYESKNNLMVMNVWLIVILKNFIKWIKEKEIFYLISLNNGINYSFLILKTIIFWLWLKKESKKIIKSQKKIN